MTGVGHGIGFGIYAFLAAVAFATAISIHETAETGLKWAGVCILIWLGYTFLNHARKGPSESNDEEKCKMIVSNTIGLVKENYDKIK